MGIALRKQELGRGRGGVEGKPPASADLFASLPPPLSNASGREACYA